MLPPAERPVPTPFPLPGTLFPPLFPTVVLAHSSALIARTTSSGKSSLTHLTRLNRSGTSSLGSLPLSFMAQSNDAIYIHPHEYLNNLEAPCGERQCVLLPPIVSLASLAQKIFVQ